MTGDCRKLHNGELRDLCSSPNPIWLSNQGRQDKQDLWHAWGENISTYRWRNL